MLREVAGRVAEQCCVRWGVVLCGCWLCEALGSTALYGDARGIHKGLGKARPCSMVSEYASARNLVCANKQNLCGRQNSFLPAVSCQSGESHWPGVRRSSPAAQLDAQASVVQMASIPLPAAHPSS